MSSELPDFISIYDNSEAAHLVYLSDSVVDAIGWTPEELVGKRGFDYFHPNEIPALARVHAASVMNEKLSSMVRYHTRHKDGHYVEVETVVHYCYDVIVCTNFVYDANDTGHKIRSTMADEVWSVDMNGTVQLAGSWGDNQERVRQTLESSEQWIQEQQLKTKQEPRFCMILNRFTCDSTIVFVSQMAERIVGLDCERALGKSLLNYVCDRDLDTVQAQLDLIKSSGMIMRLRFDWVINDNGSSTTQPVEAIASSTNDGLAVVFRLAPRVTIK